MRPYRKSTSLCSLTLERAAFWYLIFCFPLCKKASCRRGRISPTKKPLAVGRDFPYKKASCRRRRISPTKKPLSEREVSCEARRRELAQVAKHCKSQGEVCDISFLSQALSVKIKDFATFLSEEGLMKGSLREGRLVFGPPMAAPIGRNNTLCP